MFKLWGPLHTRDEIRLLRDQYKPHWDRGYSEIEVWDDYPRPTKTVSYFVKDIYAKPLVESLLCHFRNTRMVLLYELQLSLTDADGRNVFDKSIHRKTSIFGFSKKQTSPGFRISKITVNKHIGPDFQRNRDYAFTTIRMHVDLLKEIRSVTGILKF